MNHIKNVGPHPHEWRTAHTDGTIWLQECTVCGTRRAHDGYPTYTRAIRASVELRLAPWQQTWIEGGDLPESAR